ncbi:uncharacterized protein LOC108718863 [Xenopus laevis]|uniref:Uncharacterized protein LOC108718863 n=2 Tax=Xenopus laevis TaxID=8355 RepID=A0A1L8I329_XENLA|nr:uncharacterized protein LOC108718863 [Xenopus laevis]OCU02770.1 hypothetical protein XELAEV_18008540mg [Xenopus laevis]
MDLSKLCAGGLWMCFLLGVTEAQGFMIRNVQLEKCIRLDQDSGQVSIAKCKHTSKHHSLHQQWCWDPEKSFILSVKSNECLTVPEIQEFSTLKMEPCESKESQAWTLDKMGHLILQPHGLYLTAKSKKVFVSKGKNKFSIWKIPLDAPVCKSFMKPSEPTELSKTQEMDTITQLPHEVKYDSTRAEVRRFPSSPDLIQTSYTTQSPGHTTTLNSTDTWKFSPRHNGEVGQQLVSGRENTVETQYQYRQGNNNWKVAMLVLSPLTFILGMIILAMNVRMNKKRKLQSHYPKPIHKLASAHEQCPLTASGGTTGCSRQGSPTMKHGEILIEWKDGTITPLFDQQTI